MTKVTIEIDLPMGVSKAEAEGPDIHNKSDRILEDFEGNNLFDTAQEAQELKDSVLFDFGTDEGRYDYGIKTNEKLRSLGWTPEQYDRYLDYLHQEKSIDSLVANMLYYAPVEDLIKEANDLGIFEGEV